ncbi:hypothetical protein AMECASPLE_031694 [Ameca splendens]|uniref:Uncharacterized protein n=1 Tax=Ameca splendens TaxID=208324 RepID=A0ABV1A2L3_9TELE
MNHFLKLFLPVPFVFCSPPTCLFILSPYPLKSQTHHHFSSSRLLFKWVVLLLFFLGFWINVTFHTAYALLLKHLSKARSEDLKRAMQRILQVVDVKGPSVNQREI